MKKLMCSILVFALLLSTLAGCSNSSSKSNVSNNKNAVAADPKLTVNKKVHIDQVGYRTGDKKQVIISGRGGAFEVIDSNNGKSVYSGKTEQQSDDTAGTSGDIVYLGDFSSVTAPGKYYIEVSGFGNSYEFSISDDVYNNVKDITLKGLYYQRCGIRLDSMYAGKWSHGECHQSDGIIYTSQDKTIDGKGGWHDAGDYGRYSVAASITAADIMLAYDFFPAVFSDKSSIPESGNDVPDVLDEARYGLEWLLKMQDQTSGGVYHKLTSSGFPDLITMPEADVADQYFTPISSMATGDFTAVMAMAARIFKPFDSEFSDKCLEASEKAWKWLLKNKDLVYENPVDITTGAYADSQDGDERFWAAAELLRTTGKPEYRSYIKKLYSESLDNNGFGWYNVGGFGSVAYIYADQTKADKDISKYLKLSLVNGAKDIRNAGNGDAYRVTLSRNDYGWGSNMNLMNQAMQLIVANKLSPDKEFLQAAENNLHYLLGRNTMDKTYITGIGSNPVLQPHHRPSVGDGIEAPVPGLVCGGPDKNLDDEVAKTSLQGMPPAKCYIDDANSYSTNEIDTYWISPVVFVAAAFSVESQQ